MLRPREVVEVFNRLNVEPELLFDPDGVTEVLADPEVERLLGGRSDSTDGEVLTLAFRCLAIQHNRGTGSDAELVCTIPGGLDSGTRGTRMVLREMFGSAKREVIVFGFSVTDEELEMLVRELGSHVESMLILDRRGRSPEDIRAKWPMRLKPPRIFLNRAETSEFQYAKMHSKAVIVDGDQMLITSANLTLHGLDANIEIGIRIRGETARKGWELTRRLVESRLLQEV